MVKYTKDILSEAIRKSESWAGVLRALGKKKLSGGLQEHLKRQAIKFGIKTDHFTGQGHNKGKLANNRLSPEEVLVLREEGHRQKRHILWRCLLEIGRKNVCEECGLGPVWNEKGLVLQIDHVNGNFLDDRAENLRILCPNCHTQTPTFSRNRDKAGMSELADERLLESRAARRAGSTPAPGTIQNTLFE